MRSLSLSNLSGNTTAKGDEEEVHFIAKMNPRRELELFQKMNQSFFTKEGRFLDEIVPRIQTILQRAEGFGVGPLCVPKCYFVDLAKSNQEVILMENLHSSGFRPPSRFVPLDVHHILLVLEEQAKLHAACRIILQQEREKDVHLKCFNYMEDRWLHPENEGAKQYIGYCTARIRGIIAALKVKIIKKQLKLTNTERAKD